MVRMREIRMRGTRRALLVIDVQDSFRLHRSWEDISDPRIVEKAAALARHARTAGEAVIWILHAEPGSGDRFDPAHGLVRLAGGLGAEESEPVVVKSSHNAFTTTHLQRLLTAQGITDLRICGIRTEQCVETTTRVAGDLGYRAELVIDATATHPLPLHDGTGTLAPDALIARTAAVLSGRFAAIVTLEQLGVEGWNASGPAS